MEKSEDRRTPLTFRRLSAANPKAKSDTESGQFLLQNRETFAPNTLGCLYGAHLHLTTVKANSAKKAMEAVAFLMTWSAQKAPSLGLQIARGDPPRFWLSRSTESHDPSPVCQSLRSSGFQGPRANGTIHSDPTMFPTTCTTI